jgi:quinol monooxygenase YgiN
MPQIPVIAKLIARPGKRDEVIAALSELVSEAENEPGTLVYTVAADTGEDVTVWVFEVYADDAAIQAHISRDAFKATVTKTQDITVPGEYHILKPLASKGLSF